MNITVGLFNNMVLQRGQDGLSNQLVEGECATTESGAITAVILMNGKRLRGFSGIGIGAASKGKFKAVIKGLPTGGPYEILLSAGNNKGKESILIQNVLVGDVWILAGQSNMQGMGHRKDRLKPNLLVRSFYMDDHWDTAQDPLHDLGIAIDAFHQTATVAPYAGTGPGVAFGHSLLKLTGIPQGLIPCAHGGTSMAQWSPSLKLRGGASLYGAMWRRFVKNGSRVAGVFWYQGCSDTDPGSSKVYADKMAEFIKAIRKDFKDASLPVVVVQIARFCGFTKDVPGWNSIREQQRLLPRTISNVLTVPALDLELEDFIHISGRHTHRLGRRCAEAMAVLKCKDRLPPIELKEAVIATDPLTFALNVHVSFKNVSGRLKAKGRPTGFELTDNPDKLGDDAIFKTELCGETVILKTGLSPMQFHPKYLYHGFGTNPYCNITDSFDRALPAFGPLTLFADTAYAPPITRLQASEIQPSAGKLHGLVYPLHRASLGFLSRSFGDNSWRFCSMHPELSEYSPEDRLVYFSSRFRCEERMKVDVLIGYDGPVKVWYDGKEIHHNPHGTNPALPDAIKLPVTMSKGEHEVMVALGSNHGKAWGIFLRLRREDIPKAVLEKGKDFFKTPKLLD